MEQTIIHTENELDKWLNDKHTTLLVCDEAIRFLDINRYFERLRKESAGKIIRFSDFEPNPGYSSVVEGVRVFHENNCDSVIAVGGGSAMDVAKCIKLYSGCGYDGSHGEWLNAPEGDLLGGSSIPFLAMPTSAGTGSEATRYAVIYYQDNKQSITSDSIIPDVVLMDGSVLNTLPLYQKKSTMLDALCHAIESCWSVNSTQESTEYSTSAIISIIENMDEYLLGHSDRNNEMLMAANTAGKAINITQTTAGHAMCYKVTSLFGLSHGHAAALIDRVLYPWMVEAVRSGRADVIDPRGVEAVRSALKKISLALGCDTCEEGAEKFNAIFDSLELKIPNVTDEQIRILTGSVNPVRLKNHPVRLNESTIEEIYRKVFSENMNE